MSQHILAKIPSHFYIAITFHDDRMDLCLMSALHDTRSSGTVLNSWQLLKCIKIDTSERRISKIFCEGDYVPLLRQHPDKPH